MEKAESPRNIADLHGALAESPEFAEFKDAALRRHKLYQLIAEHPDPLWREIGQQLRDGHLRPLDVLSTPEYREHLEAGMADGLARLTQMVGALEERLRTEAVDETPDREAANSDEDLAETLGPILRRR